MQTTLAPEFANTPEGICAFIALMADLAGTDLAGVDLAGPILWG